MHTLYMHKCIVNFCYNLFFPFLSLYRTPIIGPEARFDLDGDWRGRGGERQGMVNVNTKYSNHLWFKSHRALGNRKQWSKPAHIPIVCASLVYIPHSSPFTYISITIRLLNRGKIVFICFPKHKLHLLSGIGLHNIHQTYVYFIQDFSRQYLSVIMRNLKEV